MRIIKKILIKSNKRQIWQAISFAVMSIAFGFTEANNISPITEKEQNTTELLNNQTANTHSDKSIIKAFNDITEELKNDLPILHKLHKYAGLISSLGGENHEETFNDIREELKNDLPILHKYGNLSYKLTEAIGNNAYETAKNMCTKVFLLTSLGIVLPLLESDMLFMILNLIDTAKCPRY